MQYQRRVSRNPLNANDRRGGERWKTHRPRYLRFFLIFHALSCSSQARWSWKAALNEVSSGVIVGVMTGYAAPLLKYLSGCSSSCCSIFVMSAMSCSLSDLGSDFMSLVSISCNYIYYTSLSSITMFDILSPTGKRHSANEKLNKIIAQNNYACKDFFCIH